jgi:MinD-like ATPase involved in chromosome partitioning or flagellar assembly
VLSSILDKGKLVVVIAGTSDGIGAWATATGHPCFPYPLSGLDQTNLLEYLSRYASGGIDKGDMYRRSHLGSDLTARMQSGMSSIRKIAVSGPKGGTGKTTVAVNLAVAFALCGVNTYLVDADGNVGSFLYHLRLSEAKSIKRTLLQLIREVQGSKTTSPSGTPFENLANSGKFLHAFTDIELLPTLKVIPGLRTEELGTGVLGDEDAIDATIKGLYEAGTAAGGVVVMDVGLNPSHPIHRAALAYADAISIVIRPEVPDIAITQHWMKLMITALAYKTSEKIATEFIASRVKLCYNMVFDDGLFRSVHKYLNNALLEDQKIGFSVVPNGILPFVNQHLAFNASSSDRITDIFAWRYKKEHTEDLAQFTDAMVSFGTQFLPVLRDAAARIGLVANGQAKKKSPLALFSRG